MKYTKLLLSCLIIVMFTGCASTPKEVVRDEAKHNWVHVYTSSSAKFYLDTLDVAEGSGRVAFLSKVEFFDIQHVAGITYKSSNVMFLVLRDKMTYAIYESYLYDTDGNQVHYSPPNNNMDFSSITEGAPIQKLYREALKYL